MSAAVLRIAEGLTLPQSAVTQTFAILAKRGVGKTYTAAVMVEEMLTAHLRVCVVDPLGVWWGLRSSADGKHEGLPITILGGDHGDLPLESTGGAVVADLLVDERASLLLDLGRFRKAEQCRFMLDFAERLYHRNRAPLHLVLDEADAFAPQRPMHGQERLLGAIEDLVRRGRARGIGITMVTQRAAVLNKDVLTQAEVLIALRTIAPQDREAVEAWTKAHGTAEQQRELMTSLPALPVGTAWFWSPGWLDVFKKAKVRRRTTFDSSSTPDMARRRMKPRQLAKVDLATLKVKMAATIERAKMEDPRLLHQQIADLQAKVRQLAAAQPKPQPAPKPVPIPTAQPLMTKREMDKLDRIGRRILVAGEAASKLGQLVLALLDRGKHQAQLRVVPAVQKPGGNNGHPPVKVCLPRPAANDTGLVEGARRLVEVLAQYPDRLPLSRGQASTLAILAPGGGTTGTYWSRLRTEGWLDEADDGRIRLAKRPTWAPRHDISRAAVVGAWSKKMAGGATRMLEVIHAQADWMDRSAVAEKAGLIYGSGTFGTYLSALRSTGLLQFSGQGVKLAEFLLEGIPR
jgi:hypothetical protein